MESGTLSAKTAGAGLGRSCRGCRHLLVLQSTSGIALGNSVTLNDSGVGGTGALTNSGGTNSISGSVTLGSNAQINVASGSLTLSGSVQGLSYTLTKAGTSTLVLAGNSSSTFPGTVTVANGTLNLQNSNALGRMAAS